MTADDPAARAALRPGELTARLTDGLLAALDLFLVHLGGQLGLYRALAESGAATSADVAARCGLDERYVREWLQAQVVSGLLTATGDDAAAASFELAEGTAEVVLDALGTSCVLPLADGVAAVGQALPSLLDAFRTGRGVTPATYGADFVAVQAAASRALYAHELVERWVPAHPALARRLADVAAPARVADVGCGGGWAAIELARAYPHLTVEGFDVDPVAVGLARKNAYSVGAPPGLRFEVRDPATQGLPAGGYDVVALFNCLHELARPEDVLRHVREGLAPGGLVLVQEDDAPDGGVVAGDDAQRFIAASSALICLPLSRVDPGSAALGARIGPMTVRRYARQAGFPALAEQLIGDLRFYLMTDRAGPD